MDEDSENAPNQSPSSSGSAGRGASDWMRKAGAEHPGDVEREHEQKGRRGRRKVMRKRRGARRRKTARFLNVFWREEQQNMVSDVEGPGGG